MNELTAVDDCVGVYTMQCRLLDYFLKDLASVHILADMVRPRFDLDQHWFDLHKQRTDKVPFHTELWCERELAGKVAGVASRVLCKRHLPHTTQHTVHSQRHTLLDFFFVFTFICVFRTWGMIILLARFSNEKVL